MIFWPASHKKINVYDRLLHQLASVYAKVSQFYAKRNQITLATIYLKIGEDLQEMPYKVKKIQQGDLITIWDHIKSLDDRLFEWAKPKKRKIND